LIISALSHVCASIAKVSIDLDSRVGKEVYSFSHLLFDLIDQDQMIPFFHIFLVYLCSGISHINEKVRSRSLTFSKLLISHYPKLASRNTNRLLPLFLQLLCGRGSASTLTNNLKFREDILERVEVLLSLHASSAKESGDKFQSDEKCRSKLQWNQIDGDVFNYQFLSRTRSVLSLVETLDQRLGKKHHKELFIFAPNSDIPFDVSSLYICLL
jgi:hypothetical protein